MAKEPVAGRVKTRLGQDIGMTNAAWWFRHQTRRLIRRLRDPRWDLVLAVSPDVAARESRVWPLDIPRMPQGAGDIGQRMRNCLSSRLGPAVLIGADIPGVTPAHIAQAFRTLGANDTVIGPAKDGGFWLVGLKNPQRAPKSLFGNTRWSHPQTLADALPSLTGRVALLDQLSDVDTADDLQGS